MSDVVRLMDFSRSSGEKEIDLKLCERPLLGYGALELDMSSL